MDGVLMSSVPGRRTGIAIGNAVDHSDAEISNIFAVALFLYLK